MSKPFFIIRGKIILLADKETIILGDDFFNLDFNFYFPCKTNYFVSTH